MKILIIQTGGTIDKEYAEKAGVFNFEINEPAVKRVLERINPNFEYEILSVLKKDSLDMTDADRAIVLKSCIDAKEEKILITHGTDTMVKTAELLNTIKDKTIVITGSKKPEKFQESDAQFNIGAAIGALNLLKPGVYIIMNGKVYDWDKCIKDPRTANFIDK